jgi:nitrite reductase (NO-forming)
MQLGRVEGTEVRKLPDWPKDALRITFGVVWLIDAIMKWLPAWLHGWFTFWINLQAPSATFFAYVVAVIETAIALALIFGFARKLTYVSAIVFSLLIWATAEGFGGPYTSGAADIGTAIVYALVFASLLVLNAQCGPARYSVDALIERRVPWWYRIAEVGHRAPQPPALAIVPESAAATVSAASAGHVAR